MKYLLLSILLIRIGVFYGQNSIEILTQDIDNFWEAYDELAHCKTSIDSIRAFQRLYIERGTEGLKAFIKVRDFTAAEYYEKIKQAPKFWASIRPNTLKVKSMMPEIRRIYDQYEAAYPGHKKPKLCFAIGTLRTGGTTSRKYILIGTEMITADSTVDKSELNSWLQAVMTDQIEVPGIVAHEYVHTQQRINLATIWSGLNHRLLLMTLLEGSCDFLAEVIVGTTINKHIRVYGEQHEEEIWASYEKDMFKNKTSNWLYQGNNTRDGQPADLGYYVGYKISQAYFEQAEDKDQALRDILVIKNYKRLLKKSGYVVKKKGVNKQK